MTDMSTKIIPCVSYLHVWLDVHSTELTFAGLNALNPRMIEVFVTDISAFLEPTAAARTTTESPGFLESAALGALLASNPGYTCRRGYFCKKRNIEIRKKHRSR